MVSGLKDKPLTLRSEKHGLRVQPFNSFGLGGSRQFVTSHKRIDPDFILATGGPETTLAASLTKKPIVIRLKADDRDFNPSKPSKRFILASRLSSYLVPAPSLVDRFARNSRPVVDVMLGCDTKKFYYSVNQKNTRPTIVILGRLDPVKGHGAFLLFYSQVLRYWPRSEPKPLLKIIGEPANISRRELLSQAADVGLKQDEDFELITKRLSNINEELSSAHVGVICSQGSEIICRVASEFLLCGTPIFTSGVGTLKDCLKDPSFGMSYDNLDLKRKLERFQSLLLSSFNETSETKKRRAELATSFFSLERMGEDLDDVMSSYQTND